MTTKEIEAHIKENSLKNIKETSDFIKDKISSNSLFLDIFGDLSSHIGLISPFYYYEWEESSYFEYQYGFNIVIGDDTLKFYIFSSEGLKYEELSEDEFSEILLLKLSNYNNDEAFVNIDLIKNEFKNILNTAWNEKIDSFTKKYYLGVIL